MSKDTTFKYEAIAEHLIRLIEKKRYLPGDRLPSVRALCRQFQVSQSTILTVYALLENEGYVDIRPQSGCYVCAIETNHLAIPEKSRPEIQLQWVDLNEILVNTCTSGLNPQIAPFGVMAPDPNIIPHKALNRILANLCRTTGGELAYYDFAPGNPVFREAMAKRSHHWGCDLEPDDFVATSGALEALNLAFKAVCQPGDVVAVESPVYYGFLQILNTLGLQALEIPTDPQTGMDLDILEANIVKHRVKAVAVIPNFNNPMGFFMPDAHKQHLVEMTARHGIPVIEDDVYGDLHYGPTRPKPVKAFDRSGLVLYCSSFSKTLIPGYRSGWCVPGQFLSLVKRYKWMSTSANASLPQMAIVEFLRRGSYDKHLRRFRRILANQMQRLSLAIYQYFPEDVRMTRPMGGYALWMELPKQIDSVQLYEQALQQNISITPGPVFSASGQYRHFIRLNYGFLWNGETEPALKRLGHIVKSLASHSKN